MRNQAPNFRTQKGASLLEVLIAVLILAIGLLGIAALQAVTLRNMEGSGARSVAAIQTYAMFDVMRANRDDALDGLYDTAGLICEAPEAGGTRIDEEKGAWIEQLQATVSPTACGEVDCVNGGECTITVRWNEADRLVGGDETHDVITRSTL